MPPIETISVTPIHLATRYVYIDNSSLRAAGFDWTGKRLKALLDLCQKSAVRLLTTQINREEVKAGLRRQYMEMHAAIAKFPVLIKQLEVGEGTGGIGDIEVSVDKLFTAYTDWLEGTKPLLCNATVDIEGVFRDYFNCVAPFEAGKKKSEFPDAVVIAQLRVWCKKNDAKVYLISKDSGFKLCREPDFFIHLDTVEEFVTLAVASAELIDDIEHALSDNVVVLEKLTAIVDNTEFDVETDYLIDGKIITSGARLLGYNVVRADVQSVDGEKISGEIHLEPELELEISIFRAVRRLRYSEEDHLNMPRLMIENVYTYPSTSFSFVGRMSKDKVFAIDELDLNDLQTSFVVDLKDI